jgi:hypothetical protein
LLDGKDDSGATTGRLLAAVQDFIAVATGQTILSVAGAGLVLQSGAAWLAGDNVALAGGSGIGVYRGQKAWVPAFEADLLESPYGQVAPVFSTDYDALVNANTWLEPFGPGNRYNVQFEFRTSAEYGTLQALPLEGGSEFHVYQATWASLKQQNQAMLAGVTLVPWNEKSVNDTFPWPGGEVYGGDSGYVKVDPESTKTNISDFRNELTKIRKEVVNQTDNLKAVGFNEYEVAQT